MPGVNRRRLLCRGATESGTIDLAAGPRSGLEQGPLNHPRLRARRHLLVRRPAPSSQPSATSEIDLKALLRLAPSLDRVRSRRSEDPESRANDGYQLLEALRDKVGGMLLLTATPMQLHEFELYSMVELVEPGLFNGFGDFTSSRQEIAAINRAVTALRSDRPSKR